MLSEATGAPRVLMLCLKSYYGSGHGTSGEEQFWGGGMFGRLGYDEHRINLEDAGSADLERIIKAYEPYEFVVFCPYQEVPHWLRGMVGPATPIVSMHSDGAWRYESFDRHFMSVSDFIWTTDEQSAEKFKAAGYDGCILSNWAARPEWALRNVIEVSQRGASFAGWTYGDRMVTLKAIGDAGDITVIAHNCRDRLLTPDEYHRFMASWAFALCLTKSSQGVRQMKGRMFEPQIHGSVLVTEPMDGLERWWTPDEDCLVFNSPAEAQNKMRWLLADPARYLTMSERAYKRVLAEHTWYHRFREILGRMGKTPPQWPSVLLQEPQAMANLEALKTTRRVGAIPMASIDGYNEEPHA